MTVREILDRRIRHQADTLGGVVRQVFTEGGQTYARVYVNTLGEEFPCVRVNGTAPTIGALVSIQKREGRWFLG